MFSDCLQLAHYLSIHCTFFRTFQDIHFYKTFCSILQRRFDFFHGESCGQIVHKQKR